MANTMVGHELVLHKTNSHGYVATCSCGWYGVVHPTYRMAAASGKPGKRCTEAAMAKAAREHREHAADVGPLTYTMPIEQFIPTVRRLGRFGHA